jgi:DNA-binding NarL/FixJ family response regulator
VNAEKMIRVSLVEDNAGARQSLVAVLEQHPHLRLTGIFATAEDALAKMLSDPPDVALIDINLPGMNGIELVAKLKLAQPDLQMLILTSYEESTLIFEALRSGASGYLLKKSIPTELVPAIEQVQAGGAPMSFQVARKVVGFFREREKRTPPDRAVETLTGREQDILALLAQGYLIKEISDQLGMAFHTARTHLRNIYKKLHVQSRSEAILRYWGHSDPARQNK